MARYRYKAVAPGGEVTEGEMEAVDRDAVVARLQALDHVPIRADAIAVDTPAPAARGWWQRLNQPVGAGRGVRPRELALFTRETATLLGAGLPLDRALTALQVTSRSRGLGPVVSRALERVRGGAALSAALTGLTPAIGGFYLAMVRAGEAGGKLELALERLADYLERAGELTDKVVAALVYPVVLMVATALSLALLFAFVIPQFEQMFRDSGHALPFATQALVGLSHALRDWGWLVLLLLLAGLIWLRWRLNDPRGRLAFDARLLGLPLIGKLAVSLATERAARALGTLLAGGVTLPRALELASEVSGNRALGQALAEAAQGVTEGRRLSAALADSGRFAPVTVELVKVGEETGRLADLLLRAADTEGRGARATIDRLVALMVPTLTLVLGLIVGAVVLAVMAAVVGLYDLVL
jgi:general secretion pathway protein F